MNETMSAPQRLLILDIDGLRQDVFLQGLSQGRLPNFARLFGQGGIHLDAVSTAPSITFCAQTTLFTGAQPGRHGITGNQFLDRFEPRFYAFDVGDTLDYDDAVRVFAGLGGLLNEALDSSVPTLYQRAAREGWSSLVAHHMLSRGAETWLRPGLIEIARLTRGSRLFGMEPEDFDGNMVRELTEKLQKGARPEIITAYFLGLDQESHEEGPEAQLIHLAAAIDLQVGQLLDELERQGMLAGTLAAVVSDHGQVGVRAHERHALRVGFPAARELGSFFDALGLDVHDLPGEDNNCEAAVGLNGGMAHVYLRRRPGAWSEPPRFDRDVLPVAQAFWEASASGRYAAELRGAIDMILIRSVEKDGWQADYRVYTPAGLQPVAEFLDEHPEIEAVDAVPRLEGLAGPASGDLLLVTNYRQGYYFGDPQEGVHGGLHPDDSRAVLSLAWPGSRPEDQDRLARIVRDVVEERKQNEGRQHASLADFVPIIETILGW